MERLNNSSTFNMLSKQISTRKIILNDQTYEIDMDKMKRRRLRNK